MAKPIQKSYPAVVIVQARMGSSRLPGKMMEDLAGRPLIWHILQRARQVRSGLPVVLATTGHPRDDVLAAVADDLQVHTVRGSEDDVLGRFLQVLEEFPAPYVVRICGDSPLFDPGFVDMCLATLEREQADMVAFPGTPPSLFQGGGVISAHALRYSRQHAGDDPLATEHVTAWAKQEAAKNSQVLRTTHLEPVAGLMLDIKLSIDTAEDLEKLRALYADLYEPGQLVDLRRAAEWLIAHDRAGN